MKSVEVRKYAFLQGKKLVQLSEKIDFSLFHITCGKKKNEKC